MLLALLLLRENSNGNFGSRFFSQLIFVPSMAGETNVYYRINRNSPLKAPTSE